MLHVTTLDHIKLWDDRQRYQHRYLILKNFHPSTLLAALAYQWVGQYVTEVSRDNGETSEITNTYRQDRTLIWWQGVIVAIKDGFVTNRININIESEQVCVKLQIPETKLPHVALIDHLQNVMNEIK